MKQLETIQTDFTIDNMTVQEAIQKEFNKTKIELERLQGLLDEMKESGYMEAVQECPECKTKNFHYYPSSNSWCCAFC